MDTPMVEISGEQNANELLGLYDAPAYIRRARGMEEATARLIARCQIQRRDWLAMVQLRLGQLHALAGEWSALEPLLSASGLAALVQLHAELQPKLRVPTSATTSARTLRRALTDLQASIERFNQRWRAYLEKVDLSGINALREGYNRYYVLEKSCAVRSDAVARQGFEPLPPMELPELLDVLPLLPVVV